MKNKQKKQWISLEVQVISINSGGAFSTDLAGYSSTPS